MPITSVVLAVALVAQAAMGEMTDQPPSEHSMIDVTLFRSVRLLGMAQAFPTFSLARTPGGDSPFDDQAFYLTQPVGMFNLEDPQGRVALRVTPNIEGLTLEDGELTLGGWGEGFIDSRHPHTLLHELMLSLNFWPASEQSSGPVSRPVAFSLSIGKGFAPYGTADPMSRPVVKYPTNHHLSQILERWTANVATIAGLWSVELGVFGGAEPEGPYDFSNIETFADSWSGRVTRRFGTERMASWPLELSASFGHVAEAHAAGDADHADEGKLVTELVNVAARVGRPMKRGRLYGLAEWSRSFPRESDGLWSVLGEAKWMVDRHEPYVRFERSIRPEYVRDSPMGAGFFRYDHDAEPVGATSWSIATVGYGFTLTRGTASIRPYVEAQLFGFDSERGDARLTALLDDKRAYGLSFGARILVGGDPMRMGTYGVLDSMSRMARTGMMDMPGMMGMPGFIDPPG